MDYQKLLKHVTDAVKAVDEAQNAVMLSLFDECDTLGGIVCSVTGQNGHYDVETIWRKGYTIYLHLDYPAFETDVEFMDLSISERQSIILGSIALLKKLEL